jgi:hypothetical protein
VLGVGFSPPSLKTLQALNPEGVLFTGYRLEGKVDSKTGIRVYRVPHHPRVRARGRHDYVGGTKRIILDVAAEYLQGVELRGLWV